MDKICSCCTDIASTEVNSKAKIPFCKTHSLIDFYKRQVAEFELKNIKSDLKQLYVYWCKKCDRFTDVRFLSETKKGERPKSYCYKCHQEIYMERVYGVIGEE